MEDNIAAKQLEINGLVQGVGFRPFLFSLAKQYDLTGEVSNTTYGVLATIEGTLGRLEKFVQDIEKKQPPLSNVTCIVSKQIPVTGFKTFQIIQSTSSHINNTFISPDASICDDCLFEIQNPDDRRFEYPFINCTNCGPRFTIIKDIPYDRPKTSMKAFKMCPDCQSEYDNPLDRRFHAQPNACPVCGPQVFLTDNKGSKIDLSPTNALKKAAALLKNGKILAIKGLGGFHLAVDAYNDKAVVMLRKRKMRPHKPFALMALSTSSLFNHVNVSKKETAILNSFHRPIVLLDKKNVTDNTELSPFLAPLNTCLGVMLPYTPLHYLLLKKGPDILVMTSGNRSKEPLSIDNKDALDAFSHIADYFLFHDR
ncbi:MAG: carbamoyltransferase HypF, partial [Desulfobacula sp.]|nr:carbamoyltransferase HypF [Desulfobacula sp.]